MVGLPPSGYSITAHDGHLASCDGETNRLSRPSGCPPGVSQPFHILGRSALIGLCRQNRVKNPVKTNVAAGAVGAEICTARVVLLPTVANCSHVVGPIMFEWGAMHLRRLSGVSHGLF